MYVCMYIYIYPEYICNKALYKYINVCTYICRSQWPRGLRRGSAAARLLRLWVRIPPGTWMCVCCECCALSGRGLCDELITHPEESYRLWCFVMCDLETSRMRTPWPAFGRSATEKKRYIYPPSLEAVAPTMFMAWLLACFKVLYFLIQNWQEIESVMQHPEMGLLYYRSWKQMSTERWWNDDWHWRPDMLLQLHFVCHKPVRIILGLNPGLHLTWRKFK